MVYRLTVLAREAGFRGLFAGLGPRMIMTAGLVSSQFLMYGGLKTGKFCLYFLLLLKLIFSSSHGCPAWYRDS